MEPDLLGQGPGHRPFPDRGVSRPWEADNAGIRHSHSGAFKKRKSCHSLRSLVIEDKGSHAKTMMVVVALILMRAMMVM